MRHLFKTNSSKLQVSESHLKRSLCIEGHNVHESVAKLKTGSRKTYIYVTLAYTEVVQVSRGNSTPGHHSETQSLLPSFSRMMAFSTKIPQATYQYPLYDSPTCPLAFCPWVSAISSLSYTRADLAINAVPTTEAGFPPNKLRLPSLLLILP